MNAFFTSLTTLTSGLLRLSLQASLVISLVLLVQAIAGKRLSPRVRYALWLLVVLRLALPISLESRVSVYNAAQTATISIARAANSAGERNGATVAPKVEATKETTTATSIPVRPSEVRPAEQRVAPVVTPAAVAAPAASRPWPWATILSIGWLAGVVFLLARVIWIPLRLNQRLARQETAPSPAVFEILEQAKRQSGVHQVLPIVQSGAVESPALLGFVRPWLLLPNGLVEKFSAEELRLVFLHELAHLKRRDIAANWVVTLLQILHWFNPLVWYAFARMRADRELACDELALSFAPAEENRIYGHAIIKLLEGFSRPPALPGLVGILEDKQHMNRRITMITQFKTMTQWSAPAAALLLVLGAVTLTDAQTGTRAEKAEPRVWASGATIKTVLAGAGEEAGGVLSPDETMIAYVDWDANDAADIFVKELASGHVRKLTSLTAKPVLGQYAFAESIVWSPDSHGLAYSWWSGKERENDLRITAVADGATRVVKSYDEQLSYYPDDWSSDGSILLCTTFKPDRARAFVTVAVESGEVNPLLSLEWNIDAHPRLSPDAQFVAFSRTVAGNEDIYVLAVESRRLIRVTDSPRRESSPIWSPDGRTLLFSSDRRGSWDLWGVRIDQGKVVGAPFVVRADFGNYEKHVTRAGSLAFRNFVHESDACIADVSRTGTPHVGKPRPIARSYIGLTASPTWSPDGAKVAYIRQPNLICIQTLATGVEEIVDPGMRKLTKLYWSPDAAWMGLGPGGPKSFGHHVFNLQTRELRSMIDLKQDLAVRGDFKGVDWTKDGREFVVLVFPQDGTPYYEAVGLSDHRQHRLLPDEPAAQFTYFDVSPDARHVAYAAPAGTEGRVKLSVADRDLKHARVIADLGVIRNFGTMRGRNGAAVWPRWSPDGKCIAYYQNNDDLLDLYVVATDGSWREKVETGNLKHWVMTSPPQWSPDGTKLTMTLLGESHGEIGILSDFLPPERVAAK